MMIKRWISKGNKILRKGLVFFLALIMLASESLSLVQPAQAYATYGAKSLKINIASTTTRQDKNVSTIYANNLKYYNFRSDGNYYTTYTSSNLDDADGFATPYVNNQNTTAPTVGLSGDWGHSERKTQAGLQTFAVGITVPKGQMITVTYQFDMKHWGDCNNAGDSALLAEGACNANMNTSDDWSSGAVITSTSHTFDTKNTSVENKVCGLYVGGGSSNWGGTAHTASGQRSYTLDNRTGTEDKVFYRYFVLFCSQQDDYYHYDNKMKAEVTVYVANATVYTSADTASAASLVKTVGKAQDGNSAMQEAYGWQYPSETNSTSKAKTAESNLYALQVSSGASNGAYIDYFEIQYYDDSGNRWSQYIFPEAEYSSSLAWANSVSSQADKMSTAESLGLDTENWKTTSGGLKAMSTDTYITYLNHTLSYVDAILIHAGGQVSWFCSGIKFYKVIESYGMTMYSYATKDAYLDFKGVLLAEGSITYDEGEGANIQVVSLGGIGRNFAFGNAVCEVDGQANLISYPVDSTEGNKSIFSGLKTTEDATDGYRIIKQYKTTEEYTAATVYDTHQQYDYLLEIDVADVYGAGLEAYATMLNRDKLAIKDDSFIEQMAITVLYSDIFGYNHQIFIPVTLNALCFYLDTYQNDLSIAGFAQQNDQICLKCSFPYLQTITSVMLTYGQNTVTSALESTTGTVTIKANTSTGDTTFSGGASWGVRSDITNTTRDDFSFSGVSIHRMSPGKLKGTVQNNRLTYKVTSGEDEVLFYYKSDDYMGLTMNCETQLEVAMTAYEEGTDYKAKTTLNNTYLIELKTDGLDQAGTVNEIYVSFGYTTNAGEELTTDEVSLRTANEEYYGYWPATSNAFYSALSLQDFSGYDHDGSYIYSMTPGNSSYVVMEINDLKCFTSFTLRMPPIADNHDVLDDYQVSEIIFYEMTDWGTQTIEKFGEGCADNDALDRILSRTGIVTTNIGQYSNATLVQPDNTVTVQIEGKDVGSVSVTVEDNDIQDYQKMSFQAASGITGSWLRKVRTTYEVTVQVASSSSYSIMDGDPGSENQFYFQLIFKDGDTYTTSSYVNANSQLEADRFRTSQPENFTIKCNADQGDVYAIRIIPDDLSSQSDESDKLCIESISVKKTTAAGLTITYVSNVGNQWVDVYFQDDEAEQTGRYEDELATVYYIDDQKINVDLEISLMTNKALIPNGDGDNTYPQFEGSVVATVVYKTWAGKTKSTNVDVVGAIATYANKSKAADSAESTNEVSDPSYMFVPGTTNRFTLSLEDVASLVSIQLTVKGTAGETGATSGLSLKSISVRQTVGAGVLQLVKATDNGNFGEYQKSYAAGKAFNICTLPDTVKSIDLVVASGSETTSAAYRFTENSILKVSDDGVVEETQPEDAAAHDTLQVTMVPSTTTGLTTGDSATVKITYKDKYSSTYVTEGKVYYDATKNTFKCSTDSYFDAKLFCMVTCVEVTSQKSFTIGRLILTPYRSGEAMSDISKFDIGDGVACSTDAANPTKIYLSTSADTGTYYDYYSQTVYVEFDSTTVEQELTSSKDVQLSFRFLSTTDTTAGVHYTSGTYSLYAQGINKIGPRMVVAIQMQADNVSNIEMVRMKKTDDQMGAVIVRNISIGQKVRTVTSTGDFVYKYGWFNCTTNGILTATALKNFLPVEASMNAGASSTARLSPITVKVKTAADDTASGLSSGTTNAVNAQITYIDTTGAVKTTDAVDIQKTLTSGSLSAGQEATFGFLVPGMSQILEIKFTPQADSTGKAGAWKIESLEVSGNQGTTCADFTTSKTVNAWASTASALSVNVSNSLIDCKANITDGTTSSTVPFSNTKSGLYAAANGSVTLSSLTVATDQGVSSGIWECKYQVVTQTSGGEALGAATTFSPSSSITLTNNTAEQQTYRITVYAKGADTVSATLDIVLPAGKTTITVASGTSV